MKSIKETSCLGTRKKMDVISGRIPAMSSTLNPNAAPFVPWAYRAVEDFSDEWWQLVRSTPWFRDYWLRERFHEDEGDMDELDLFDFSDPALPDADALFHSYPSPLEEREKVRKEMVAWGAEKWKGGRGNVQIPRQWEKAPKIVSVKVSPRTIQQPR